jgi:hypothetical protein
MTCCLSLQPNNLYVSSTCCVSQKAFNFRDIRAENIDHDSIECALLLRHNLAITLIKSVEFLNRRNNIVSVNMRRCYDICKMSRLNIKSQGAIAVRSVILFFCFTVMNRGSSIA